MKFDVHFRRDVTDKIQEVIGDIQDWNRGAEETRNEIEEMARYVVKFDHCSRPDRPFLIGGADGSGDFPCVTYGDSFVYLVAALTRLYEATTPGKLTERDVKVGDIVEFLWLPEDAHKKNEQFTSFFERLVQMPLVELCHKSDYYEICRKQGSGVSSPDELADSLVMPEAHDAGNIAIQLLSAAEVCTTLRLIKSGYLDNWTGPIYLLVDTTFALPLVSSKRSLFFEIVKRYGCTLSRARGIFFFAISKSHNMPRMDLLEEMIRNTVGEDHWFMRIPFEEIDHYTPTFLGTRTIPPVRAVSYLFRLHKTTPAMRLDMDYDYWIKNVWNSDVEVFHRNELQIFRDLDFASHDQRSYGYPYPIKASHDMVSLTDAERVALRKQIIDAAERAGLRRKNFVDPSILMGHK